MEKPQLYWLPMQTRLAWNTQTSAASTSLEMGLKTRATTSGLKISFKKNRKIIWRGASCHINLASLGVIHCNKYEGRCKIAPCVCLRKLIQGRGHSLPSHKARGWLGYLSTSKVWMCWSKVSLTAGVMKWGQKGSGRKSHRALEFEFNPSKMRSLYEICRMF